MTREEAIDVLKRNYPSSCFTELCEAVEIAIQALSAQPEPQKWLDHNYYLECPSCNRYVTNRTPFCPYCGGRNE